MDKALLTLGGKSIIEIIAERMKPLFDQILVSVNDQQDYAFLGLPMVADIYPDAGPLAGLHAVLHASATERNFVISCDMPLMSADMMAWLAGFLTEKPVLITQIAGAWQPLPGMYNKSLVPIIVAILGDVSGTKKRRSLYALIETAGAEIVDPVGLPFFKEELFLNLNTRTDYEALL